MCKACLSDKNKENTGPDDCIDCRKVHENYATAMGKKSPFATISIDVYYTASSSTFIELPAYKTWEDVKSLYVKWNVLNIMWKGKDEYTEYELSNDIVTDDTKIPHSFSVYDEDHKSVVHEE